MRVGILGAGIVGHATGVGLRTKGNDVIFYDIDDQIMSRLRAEGLDVAASAAEAVAGSDVVILCLPTKLGQDGFDLTYIRRAVKELYGYLETRTVILRSTVTPGTTRKISETIPKDRLVYNPEFLRQAHALADFLNPYRIVIGAESEEARQTARALYKGFDAPMIVTDWETAETAKLACNAFLASKISFFNELWLLCEKLGVDSEEVERIAALDERIGLYGSKGGAPYEGACLPKDSAALCWFARTNGGEMKMLESAIVVNELMRARNGGLEKPPTPPQELEPSMRLH